MKQFDVAIIGAGIAGASIASEIGEHCSVLLLEAEDQPGYHATGRFCGILDRNIWRPRGAAVNNGFKALSGKS